MVDVGASVSKWYHWPVDGTTITLKKEDTIVNVIAIIQRDVAVIWFLMPDLRWYFDDKK